MEVYICLSGFTLILSCDLLPPLINFMKNFLLLIFISIHISAYAQTLEDDRKALVKLYNGTNGPQWTNQTNWNSGTNPCGWYGIGCSEGRVVEIHLIRNNLTGTIPIEREDLTELKWLELSHNNLTGKIPAELGDLTNLTVLALGHNMLTNAIPENLANLKNLMALSLYENQLTGSIPNALYDLPKLIILDLGTNQLTGNISNAIGNSSLLQILRLGDNQLTGSIPDGLWNHTGLQTLTLQNNNIDGAISPAIGNLVNLNELRLNNNQLRSYIPGQIGNLSKLQNLNLSHNYLYQNLSSSLGNLTELQELDLSYNDLSYNIPESFGNLTKLKKFKLNNNYVISGNIPGQIGNLTDLEELDLSSCRLSGNIPASISNLTKLKRLNLSSNRLSGVIPDLTNIPQQAIIAIDRNSFTFSGMETNIAWLDSYYVQDSLRLHLTNKILSVEAGGELANNTYRWFKNDVLIALNKGNKSFTMTGNGTYRVTVQNDLVPNLTLYGMDITFDESLYLMLTANEKVLTVNVGNNVTGKTYRWFKNNQQIVLNTDLNTLTMIGNGSYRVQVTNTDQFYSPISYSETYIFNDTPLPVTLVNFNAKKIENGNLISWSTTSETNNAGFEIERSDNAKNFNLIARIEGKGNSKATLTYQYTDINPLAENYYRLKQIDYDGKTTYSRMIHVQSETATLKAYPNPARGQFVLESSDAKSPVSVYNVLGQKVLKKPGAAKQILETDHMDSGTYIIQVGAKSLKVVME